MIQVAPNTKEQKICNLCKKSSVDGLNIVYVYSDDAANNFVVHFFCEACFLCMKNVFETHEPMNVEQENDEKEPPDDDIA